MLERHLCESCGGTTERDGNFYICQYCGTKWAIITEDAMQVKLQNAWEALRCNEFDKASELFEGIIIDNNNAKRESDSFEAYWGKALADNGIVFVNDYREDKKVPTCNNITENSFVENPDVKKAIALAPKDVSENYSFLAEKIEKIRVEWLEKARKEEPYDVFICFKDSDKEHNIERTNDSYAAQELYTELVKEGYKVFFSRVSLRDKISEQYEPYIYNALKTAKVMIVYGEKPEYFNAVWLKNEWNRFRMRIEKGEKHKNSLVVVYKNMDANDLPAALKSRQCLNAGDMMFYSTLSSHVKKVIELSAQNVHLDRIKVQGGQMGKKASSLSVNSVKTREIGAGAIAETDISEKQSIALINTYLRAHDWREANKIIDNVLFDNPGCAEAIWCRILSNNQVSDDAEFCKKIASQNAFNGFDLLEKLLNCASKDFAAKILNLFYGIRFADDALNCDVLSHIIPFAYAERDKRINECFDRAILNKYQNTFDLLLGTLQSSEVDRYISYNLSFVQTVSDLFIKRKYLKNVLSVDEGNVIALRNEVVIDISLVTVAEKIQSDFETLLKYTDNPDREVVNVIDELLSNKCVLNIGNVAFMKQALRYYSGKIIDLKLRLIKFADKLLKTDYRNDAEYYCNLVLSVDRACANAYWILCLIKIGACNEEDIPNCTVLIRSCPEFNKYLTFVDEKRSMYCIQLARKQEEIVYTNKKSTYIEICNEFITAKKHQKSCVEAITQYTSERETYIRKSRISLIKTIIFSILFLGVVSTIVFLIVKDIIDFKAIIHFKYFPIICIALFIVVFIVMFIWQMSEDDDSIPFNIFLSICFTIVSVFVLIYFLIDSLIDHFKDKKFYKEHIGVLEQRIKDDEQKIRSEEERKIVLMEKIKQLEEELKVLEMNYM